MLRKVLFVVFVFLLQGILVNTAIADEKQPHTSNIEMYGTSDQLADNLMKKYDKRLKSLAQGMTKVMLSDPDKPNYQENYDLVKQQLDSIKMTD